MQAEFRMRNARFWVTALVLGLGILACTPSPQVIVHAGGTEVRVPVELAVTPQARTHGLMYRRDLPAEAGMLFVFPDSAPHRFWMKNTPLPLDMIFISEDLRVVGVVEDTVPFSTASVGVEEPSRYVLEVHAGFGARHGIRAGDRVELRQVPPPPRS